jgi:hypothetical protein
MSNNQTFVKAFNAGGAIAANSIVKVGANDYDVLQAAAAADKLLGASTDLAAATGERCDVVLEGIVDLKINGTVARGDFITSDASGLGITATASAGANVRAIGVAIISGVAGDIIPVYLSPVSFQG